MGVQTTLNIPVARLQQFQALVKQHDLRFVGNPLIFRDNARVTVHDDHLPTGSSNAFFRDWYRLTTPIVEKQSSRWHQFARRVKALLK